MTFIFSCLTPFLGKIFSGLLGQFLWGKSCEITEKVSGEKRMEPNKQQRRVGNVWILLAILYSLKINWSSGTIIAVV